MADLKRFQITRLPNYIILHIKRFSKNSFVEEKNPTIVTFPIKNLSMAECRFFQRKCSNRYRAPCFQLNLLQVCLLIVICTFYLVVSNPETEKVLGLHYDLLANITHEGDPATPNSTSYKVHIQHRAKEQWYQIQDLFVEEINAHMIFLSESYIQVIIYDVFVTIRFMTVY